MDRFAKSPEPASDYGTADVLCEFVNSAVRTGVERPIKGLAQVAGFQVAPEAPQPQLEAAMKYANIAGSGAGVVLDLIVLSKFMGRGVDAMVRSNSVLANSLLAESAAARSLTTSALTGFVDGAYLTPVGKEEGFGRRMLNGTTEAAAFMAVDGTSKALSSSFADGLYARVGARFAEGNKALEASQSAAPSYFQARVAKTGADLIGRGLSKIPDGVIEAAAKNATAGYVGGSVYYSMDTVAHGRKANLNDAMSTAMGWAVGNAVVGGALNKGVDVGKTSFAPPAPGAPTLGEPFVGRRPMAFDPVTMEELKGTPTPPNDSPTNSGNDGPGRRGPARDASNPLATEKNPLEPVIETLPDGGGRWTYKDLPAKGDRTVYNQTDSTLTWRIETAAGKVITADTPGPWQVRYEDGAKMYKDQAGDLFYAKPRILSIDGKRVETAEIARLTPDHQLVSTTWEYADPTNAGKTLSSTIEPSTPSDKAAQEVSSRKPWALSLVPEDASPMSLSSIPRQIRFTDS